MPSNSSDSPFATVSDYEAVTREKNPNFPKAAGFKDSHSLLLLDLHGEAFHVGVFKVEAEVLPAEAQVGRHAVRRQSVGGLGRRDGRERLERRGAAKEQQ